MVLAAFSISELPTLKSQEMATQMLWECVKPGGIMLIVEKGNPGGIFEPFKCLANTMRFQIVPCDFLFMKLHDPVVLNRSLWNYRIQHYE